MTKEEQEAAKRRCIVRRYIRKNARQIAYAAAVSHAKHALKDADPRPGKMTDDQEWAQRNVINAFLDENPLDFLGV